MSQRKFLTKTSFSQNKTIYSIVSCLLNFSVASNYHQADISVHGHDMFSAYGMGSISFTFAVYNFRNLDNKLVSLRF